MSLTRNHRACQGLTIIEVVVSIGLLGILVAGATTLFKNHLESVKQAITLGEEEDIRIFLRRHFDCSESVMKRQAAECKGNKTIVGYQSNGTPIPYYSGSKLKLGAYELQLSCSMVGSIKQVQGTLTASDGKQENLFKIPLVCGYIPCSAEDYVEGDSNPWLAGMPNGTSITYSYGGPTTDRAPNQSPKLMSITDPECLEEGKELVFNVNGLVSNSKGGYKANGADGSPKEMQQHYKGDNLIPMGPLFGKSNLTAPMDALIGLFLSDADPTTVTPPPALYFGSAASRNQQVISPQLNQPFFIGDGYTSSGIVQKFIVPKGTTRVYVATMDGFEWNNNSGGFKVQLMTSD